MLRYFGRFLTRGCSVALNGKKTHAQALEDLGRQMGVYSVMFHNAIAERLGLNVTDHKCLDYIIRTENVTAGRLSQVTGLTTGAITGVIDRLEKAGFARRQPDPRDRRKVIIVPRPEKLAELSKLFDPLNRKMARVMARYSARDFEVLIDFMQRIGDVMREENLKLRNAR